MRLIDVDTLLKIIENDKINLNIHKDGKAKLVHIGEYNHFLKRIMEQPIILDEEVLTRLLLNYFNVPRDTYAYNLNRVKEAFSLGTMTFDDFEEFDEETIDDIVGYIINNVNKGG